MVALDDVRTARDRAVDALLTSQSEHGWWKGLLETNVTIEAEDLLLREFLGIRTDEITRLTANWIRAKQRSDGTWATFHEGPADLSVTVEAYWALRLAGDPPDASHMDKAATYIRDAGGLERTRVFTRIWMALFGLWSWDELPALPPEWVLLPSWFPLNKYDFACWARQTIAPLTIVGTIRPVRPSSFDLAELRTGRTPAEREPRPRGTWSRRFQTLDRALHVYHRHPVGPLRELAMRRAEQWIIERQEADGCWGGIQPPWVYSILALHLRGYALDHPVLAKALDGFSTWEVVDGDQRWLECCQSPVWDTALAVVALADAGLPPDHPALLRAADWLIGEEVRVRGDWAVRRPDTSAGGWAFEFENDNYPDLDDTAEVVLALGRTDHPEAPAAIERALDWMVGMQCRDGGWAAFDADNTRRLPETLPFCDFGEVIDPPTADVTAHVVEALAHHGRDGDELLAGRRWLEADQWTDGSWWGRWGTNHLYGTGAAVPALVAAGATREDRHIRAAVEFLAAAQNPDGGWGEDQRSYSDSQWRARGTSSPSQTAWALLALIAAGDLGETTRRGVEHLVETQRADGSWDEEWFTGTGFPGDFCINYHLYRLTFPTTALGRYLRAIEGAASS